MRLLSFAKQQTTTSSCKTGCSFSFYHFHLVLKVQPTKLLFNCVAQSLLVLKPQERRSHFNTTHNLVQQWYEPSSMYQGSHDPIDGWVSCCFQGNSSRVVRRRCNKQEKPCTGQDSINHVVMLVSMKAVDR